MFVSTLLVTLFLFEKTLFFLTSSSLFSFQGAFLLAACALLRGAAGGLKWTRTIDLTLIRRAL